MSLLPVEDALAKVIDGAQPQLEEAVALHRANGRVLSQPVDARRTQPPFDASAMDGYAVLSADLSTIPVVLNVVGAAAAGTGFADELKSGQAVRIFTGAPVPSGADTIVIQENTSRPSEASVEIFEASAAGRHIRHRGLDFATGDTLLEAGRVLDPAALSLAAAGNHADLMVWKKPLVALIATGDELLLPGNELGPDQIISSNAYGVGAIITQAGGQVLDLGIARDDREEITFFVQKAMDAGADIIVTLGGASVGDHDLVNHVLTDLGIELDFWKIAMRPGKPLMFGKLGKTRCLGLPGNPVSSLICSHLFLKPLVRALAGLPPVSCERDAVLDVPMPANDGRQDYVRAYVVKQDGIFHATPFATQDSSMLRTLADANAAIIRRPGALPALAGDPCRVLMLR
ncbi:MULTISPECIES: gephyrin-like molybdotransferase Glp [Mesorhizobium]|uniref:Molybdopterin molybdenumtransferase n=1 Tax=Mesorhizobium denitrificans TaxID=2294114 RepID=A0A371XDC0_9HYPH|nr:MULTISPECIES: gephyrin-like molybdotransferase Glp [Mesorhizobium]RFC67229.1 molybdopterin molybdenumtransferase MoeA [Mesorhizobium denitrificans]